MSISVEKAVTYRIPISVTEILKFSNGYAFPVCPRCKITLEREYQAYCDRCGQCLDWNDFENAKVVELK